jgi:hypothetical protein
MYWAFAELEAISTVASDSAALKRLVFVVFFLIVLVFNGLRIRRFCKWFFETP